MLQAIHIQTDKRTDQEVLPLAVAKMLKNIADREQAQLVMLGKQSIDGDNAQTGPMLSALLNWPLATFAAKVSVEGQELTVERETDSGTETIAMQLPAVVTTDLRLNEPRYATLPNIMKAKKKPLETIEASSLGVDLTPSNVVEQVNEPPSRKAGVVVESVDDLISKLKNEAGVI